MLRAVLGSSGMSFYRGVLLDSAYLQVSGVTEVSMRRFDLYWIDPATLFERAEQHEPLLELAG